MRTTVGRNGVRIRSVFISDVHLGSRGCRAGELLEFLKIVEMDYLFLVGDIVDFWSLRRSFYWPQEHNEVLRTLLEKSKQGTRVIYVPGNHDEDLREFCGSIFGKLEIHRRFVHETASGETLLVTHGDEFDTAVQWSPWLRRLGAGAYDFTLRLNRHVNAVRRWFGFPFWSLATWLKHRVGNAVQYIESFERAAAAAARRQGVDGIVCGHIHRAGISQIDGVRYCNDGDWVESCTALVEDMNGRIALWSAEDVRARSAERLVEAAA
jgi:UDP-2,3-diacylglucosamine pyrophosphatase LpxH